MKKPILLCSLLGVSSLYAQTEVIFQYDESGNQIYRGTIKDNTNHSSNNSNSFTPLSNNMSPEEIEFWNNVQLAPVPVRTNLTINSTDNFRSQINKISIYDTLGREAYSKLNTTNLTTNTTINMTAFPFGMYIISFHLKNGKIYSKHISKTRITT